MREITKYTQDNMQLPVFSYTVYCVGLNLVVSFCARRARSSDLYCARPNGSVPGETFFVYICESFDGLANERMYDHYDQWGTL